MSPKPVLLWTWPEAIEDDPSLEARLRAFANLVVAAPDDAGLPAAARECRILVPRLSHSVDRRVFDAAPRLALIATPSTGSDHIDRAAAERRGVAVLTFKDDREFLDRVQATAELTWLLILACARNLRAAQRQIDAGEWNAQAVRGHELIDRVLGVVGGAGRLGTMVARVGLAFRMNVLAADPRPVRLSGVRQVPLDELLARSDVVTLHVHLSDDTSGLIDRDALARMKPGAILVNTSRGGLVDEAALLEALASGRLAAAGLDAIEGERDPDRARRPLWRYAAEHDNLILTPHAGGCALEAQRKAFVHLVGKIERAWPALEGAARNANPKGEQDA